MYSIYSFWYTLISCLCALSFWALAFVGFSDTMAVTVPNVGLLWTWFREYPMRFRVFGLSIPPVPTLCLKDPLMGDNTIYPEFLLTVEMIRWNKLPEFWQLKDKKNSPLKINNYLVKHIGVTRIYAIYLYREIVALLSRLRTEREITLKGIWTETLTILSRCSEGLSNRLDW